MPYFIFGDCSDQILIPICLIFVRLFLSFPFFYPIKSVAFLASSFAFYNYYKGFSKIYLKLIKT